ncbi:MAG: cobalamin-dependent protein [Planctomycetes bacterium]|nr:cobalamin-dependent protein [Planctomycetota bacterium]
MAKNQSLFDAICKGKRDAVGTILKDAIDKGEDVEAILMESMIPAMRDIGDRFSRNEVYVPEMLIAARAMKTGLDLIEPILTKTGHQPVGRVAIGTVKGDLHDIGKNLVSIMLKGAGFEVDDLGVDCDAAKFAASVEKGTTVCCLSALLTTTMPYMKEIVDHFKGNGKVKVVIGGAPVTQAYANEIGAHGYADNASDAVKAVERVLGIIA